MVSISSPTSVSHARDPTRLTPSKTVFAQPRPISPREKVGFLPTVSAEQEGNHWIPATEAVRLRRSDQGDWPFDFRRCHSSPQHHSAVLEPRLKSHCCSWSSAVSLDLQTHRGFCRRLRYFYRFEVVPHLFLSYKLCVILIHLHILHSGTLSSNNHP